VTLPEDARARILACRDADALADALDRRFDRALVVAAVTDLVADDESPDRAGSGYAAAS
jgi:hypothetical protein